MIEFNSFTLDNGLQCLHYEDKSRTTAVLNVLYNVGSRDENENRTGFAHLFEHLMFGGSINIPHYDKEVEKAGGTNNAYTNNYLTNYYIQLPRENIETAFWLESDRMLQLNINEKTLEVQRNVVVEEFKQRCFNAPFGMLWHHLRSQLYSAGPYRWPTIGLEISHIQDAKLTDVEAFYNLHYHPANAIACIAGDIGLEESKLLFEKWFGSINKIGSVNKNTYLESKINNSKNLLETTDLNPDNVVILSWIGPGYEVDSSIELEVFADLLGGSETAPLHLQLVKEKAIFTSAASFYSRGSGEGLFVVYGILNPKYNHEFGEKALSDLLQKTLEGTFINGSDLERKINKYKTEMLFERTNTFTIAEKLCFYKLLGDASKINHELEQLDKLEINKIVSSAAATFSKDTVSVIYYSPAK